MMDLSQLQTPQKDVITGGSKRTKEPFRSGTLRLIPTGSSKFAAKSFYIDTLSLKTVQAAKKATEETPSNLYFRHRSINDFHAEFNLQYDELFVRDLGSESGTFINGVRVGAVGVPWTPRAVSTGTEIRFGDVEMTLEFAVKEKPNEASIEQKKNAINATVNVIFEMENKFPVRELKLRTNEKFSFGRATALKGETGNNAQIMTSGISQEHLKLWCNGTDVFIKNVSVKFPTFLNNQKLGGFAMLPSGN